MGRIKQTIENLSIRKTFMLYMLLFLLLATGLSSICINIAGDVENQINLSYADSQNQYTLNNSEGNVVLVSPPVVYSPQDKTIINICGIVEIFSIPVFFGVCIIISALLFYRNKLWKPIELLSGASEKIADNDLNFHLSYENKDEMGQLCASFETMRAALDENNRDMWRAVEERKRLNAAFSHDLRTPLTVLRGTADILKKYLPQGKISEDKLISTVSVMSDNITRLENYVQMMSEAQKLEDFTVSKTEVESSSVFEQLQNTANMLAQKSGCKLNFVNKLPQTKVCLDFSVVLRVYENLVANAVRYAASTISVSCQITDELLIIAVADDGKGFTDEDLRQAANPYYKNPANTDESHLGLGLYICRILAEKHGGYLLLANDKNGCAVVTASFSSNYKF